MMDIEQVAKLLSDKQHICVLSTVDQDGCPNAAVFGSVQIWEGQIVVGFGANNTANNLTYNPCATLLICIPGPNVLAYQGVRLYMKKTCSHLNGELFDSMVAGIATHAGRAAARTIKSVACFKVLTSRALVEFPPIPS